ncbi:MAG: N-acetyltransferase [Kastovskya adunca ATA6-11-RM4]|jgi:putative acetyltransferase|nr:N-acetyltransferase [Kastovskya adunca ATA6-11-RM4]
MNIRDETSSDYKAIAEVNREAFAQENEARLIEQIRDSDRYIPELSLVAEAQGVIVGHILFSYIDLVGEETLPVLGLAPLAVRSQQQRQGIGSALVQAGLAKADARKEAIVIVLGHPQFYSRFGFEPAISYGIESPFPVPEDVFMVKPLQHYQDKYRGKVVYPPAFHGV